MTDKQEKICLNCATGKKDYELDKHSILCSFIHCLHNNTCCRFVPLKTANIKSGQS